MIKSVLQSNEKCRRTSMSFQFEQDGTKTKTKKKNIFNIRFKHNCISIFRVFFFVLQTEFILSIVSNIYHRQIVSFYILKNRFVFSISFNYTIKISLLPSSYFYFLCTSNVFGFEPFISLHFVNTKNHFTSQKYHHPLCFNDERLNASCLHSFFFSSFIHFIIFFRCCCH